MPNAYKLMCFDRSINENKNDKILEVVRETHFNDNHVILSFLSYCLKLSRYSHFKMYAWYKMFINLAIIYHTCAIVSGTYPILNPESVSATDYGHTMAKSLILCGTNSNPNPK